MVNHAHGLEGRTAGNSANQTAPVTGPESFPGVEIDWAKTARLFQAGTLTR